MARKGMILLGAAVLLIAWAQATKPVPRPDLDGLLRSAVESKQAPAVVAMVGTRAGVAYQGAAGVPVDAIFAIASMTKPVTSVALMQLVEAGKVKLDEPAATYVPALRNVQVLDGGALRAPKSPPTVRQLLSHMSGFAYEFSHASIAELVRDGKLASLFTGTDEFLRAPLVADPGGRFEYGISTDWLGKILEAVSGQSLGAYFQARIFEPLQMRDTFFAVPSDKKGRVSPKYVKQPDGSFGPMPDAPSDGPPAAAVEFGGSGLHSTASDYLRFGRALLGGGQLDGRRILKAETVALMSTNQVGETMRPIPSVMPQVVVPNVVLPGAPDAFGLGFAVNRKPAPSGRGANSMTWAGAFNTFFWIDREKDVCAVVMTQMLPFGDPAVLKLVEAFDRAIYSRTPPSSAE